METGAIEAVSGLESDGSAGGMQMSDPGDNTGATGGETMGVATGVSDAEMGGGEASSYIDRSGDGIQTDSQRIQEEEEEGSDEW